ncbi:hypothetical protein AVEN_251652-1 [Araneus ventricosus]|uniref:Uncharacterized protein n=1 Tax=Araneus ventricosus TaxID=182803 RepID=A0A4Y2IDN0_ARAVE|nr:hypothetical protein AVEN_251652-1 [Araneus ventricosus]
MLQPRPDWSSKKLYKQPAPKELSLPAVRCYDHVALLSALISTVHDTLLYCQALRRMLLLEIVPSDGMGASSNIFLSVIVCVTDGSFH